MTTATMTRCLPILFSAPMSRAILDGRKTMTRRVMNTQPPASAHEVFSWFEPDIPESAKSDEGCYYRDARGLHFHCHPRYRVGDTLWVREPAVVADLRQVVASGRIRVRIRYEADGMWSNWITWPDRLRQVPHTGLRLSRGTFREASRITLRVEAVRCERVQDITEADALAEGCSLDNGDGTTITDFEAGTARWAFRALWDSINADRGYGWGINPWVWAYTFARVTQ